MPPSRAYRHGAEALPFQESILARVEFSGCPTSSDTLPGDVSQIGQGEELASACGMKKEAKQTLSLGIFLPLLDTWSKREKKRRSEEQITQVPEEFCEDLDQK